MSRTLVLFFNLCLALAAASDRVRFDNYHVYQVTAKSIAGLTSLQNIEGSSNNLTFLTAPFDLKKNVNVVVPPSKVPTFEKILKKIDVEYQLVETNAQSRIDEIDTMVGSRSSVYDWKSYRTLTDTYDWMRSLAEKYPNIVSIFVAGKSYEGRDILGVKISYQEGNSGIFIEGGIHAREWISPATVTYITNQLLTSTDPAVMNIARTKDWYIVPHTNPDGYAYTFSGNRLWRKTRSPQARGCFGADPNRNWDAHWAEKGSSSNPCSDSYHGTAAFSEIETRSLSEYIASLKGKLNLYIAFHSYSQLLLYPYGHSSELPENHKDYEQVYDAALKALTMRYGTKYHGGNIHDAIYPATGGSIDWAYSLQKILLTFVYELRPSSNAGWFGFQLPPNQIISTGEETMDSVVAMVNEATKLEYLK